MVVIVKKNESEARAEIIHICDHVLAIKRIDNVFIGFESFDEYKVFMSAQKEITPHDEII